MLETFLLKFVEWIATKGGMIVWQQILDVINKHKEQQNLQKNETNLQNAIKSGDQNAIDKAGENSLNNTPQP